MTEYVDLFSDAAVISGAEQAAIEQHEADEAEAAYDAAVVWVVDEIAHKYYPTREQQIQNDFLPF